MKNPVSHIKHWLWLTVPLAILIAVAAGAGVFIEDTYSRDAAYFAVQGIAQDFVLLTIVLPALLISMFFALRGSQKALHIWLGCIAYIVYSYILYAFSVQFNQWF